jgi:hypothetical protein
MPPPRGGPKENDMSIQLENYLGVGTYEMGEGEERVEYDQSVSDTCLKIE